MAQQSGTGIAHAGKRKWGYDPEQVDAFLERAHTLYEQEGAHLTQGDIQSASFELTRDGYIIAQVDAALSRLERAVVDKNTTWELSTQGQGAWRAATEALYRRITTHLDRPAGSRFADGKPKTPSYDRKQVDRLGEQVADKAAAALGLDGVKPEDIADLASLSAQTVASSTFTQRKGRKGYDERQVDYFFDACVQLLSRIESFERVKDYVNGDGTHAEPSSTMPMGGDETDAPALPAIPVTAPAAPAQLVAPLFSSAAQPVRAAQTESDDTPRPFAPVPSPALATDESQAFDALQQAEEHLFTPPAVPTPPMPVSPTPPPAPVPAAAVEPTPVPAPEPVSEPAPATPAPAPVPAPPVDAENSLAALAQMAQATQDIPDADTQSFTPSMPDLEQPSIPLFVGESNDDFLMGETDEKKDL